MYWELRKRVARDSGRPARSRSLHKFSSDVIFLLYFSHCIRPLSIPLALLASVLLSLSPRTSNLYIVSIASQMSSELWEGVGGPVRMDEANLNGIDPTLDACCRREVRL
jgi:hypothetical protein